MIEMIEMIDKCFSEAYITKITSGRSRCKQPQLSKGRVCLSLEPACLSSRLNSTNPLFPRMRIEIRNNDFARFAPQSWARLNFLLDMLTFRPGVPGKFDPF